MNKYIVLLVLAACATCIVAQNTEKNSQTPNYGTAFDEVIVESSLNVRKKPQQTNRPTRDIEYYLVAPQGRLYRAKRQFNNGGFGRQGGFGNGGFGNGGFGGFNNDYSSSSALANANSQGHHFGPDGFGASAGNAQGQAFNSQGPLGGFGAAASGAQTQGFNVGPDGFRGSAGLSGSQSYNLPNGHTINLAYTNDYSVGPDGRPNVASGNSLAYT